MSGPAAVSDLCLLFMDPNPTIDTGCPRSGVGTDNALALCQALEIPFELEDLDCEPFYQGYGMQCSEAKLTVGMWYLPLTDLHGTSIRLPFTSSMEMDAYLLGMN